MLLRALASGLIVLALSTLAATEAMGAAQRSFVASYGNDSNPCSLTQPCRSFAAAVIATSAGGEVIVLDSGGYGPVYLIKSVSIIAPPGVYAGVSVPTGTGIVVNVGSGAVVLSGLTITGPLDGEIGVTGIVFQSGSSLRLERTTISGFTEDGLHAVLSASATLIIRDSSFIANRVGLNADTSTGVLTVEITDSRFDQGSNTGAIFFNNVSGVVSGTHFTKNYFGVGVGGVANLTFRNCVISANIVGLFAGTGPGLVATVQLTDSEISDNGFQGIAAQLESSVALSNTTVTRNGTGIDLAAGGIARSFQDNRLHGNTTDGSFSSTIGKQ